MGALSGPEPPRDERELFARATALHGRRVDDLAAELGARVSGDARRTKGKVGTLVERALGARGGSAAIPDFPHLGVELKTIPVEPSGRARESTYVCTIAVADPDASTWATSWVKKKLARVLWMPVVTPRECSAPRVFGPPLLWTPSASQEAVLQDDFDEIMGLIGIGGIEGLTARIGRWLQARPKADNGRARTLAFGVDGEPLHVMPRGFYLRPHVTTAILADPSAVPE